MVPSRILLFPVSSSTLFYECSWLFGGWQKHSIDAHCAYSHRISVWLIYVRLCTLVEANKTTICIIIHMDAATRDAQEMHLPTVRGKHTIIVVEHAEYMRMAPIPEHTHTHWTCGSKNIEKKKNVSERSITSSYMALHFKGKQAFGCVILAV